MDVDQTKPIDPAQEDELPELPKPERLTEDSEAIRATFGGPLRLNLLIQV